MRKWFDIKNNADTVYIDIYGSIGVSWGDDDAVSAKAVRDAIKDANGADIVLHINSEGGSVFDAFAIMNALKNSDSTVYAYVDGLAASAASYILAAANHTYINKAAWIMIHEASGGAYGNKHELQKQAEVLSNIDNTIAQIYADASNNKELDVDFFLELMSQETWLDAEMALELGLVDEIIEDETVPIAAHLVLHDVSVLDTAPQEARSAILAATKSNTRDTLQTTNNTTKTAEQELSGDTVQEQPVYVSVNGKLLRL